MEMFEELATARFVTNFDGDATAGGNWEDTTHWRATVPTGKRWFLIGGIINRDANATVNVRLLDASDVAYLQIDSQAAGTGVHTFPNTLAGATVWAASGIPLVLDAGYDILGTFGAAQGGSAYMSAAVLEIDI